MLRSLWLYAAMAIILAAVLGVFMAGCGGGGGGSSPTPDEKTSTLTGTVTNDAGKPLGGVKVDFPALSQAGSATTLPNGTFRLASAPVGADLAIRFGRQGYVTVVRQASLPEGVSCTVDASLHLVGNSVPIDPTKPQTVADNRADGLNATVAFQANSFPTTAATVEITTAVQGDANYAQSFPGQFTGVPTGGGAPGPLESFGIAAITVRNAAGQPLQLDPAKPATLVIPMSPDHDPNVPTIALWRLDETTGVWQQIGTATRVEGTPVAYTASINHLSAFNIDIFRPSGGLKVITVDYVGKPDFINHEYPGNAPPIAEVQALPRLPGVWVTVSQYNWAGQGTTDAQGELSLSPPQGLAYIDFNGSKRGYADSRVLGFQQVSGGTAVVWIGLRSVAVGDVGAVVK